VRVGMRGDAASAHRHSALWFWPFDRASPRPSITDIARVPGRMLGTLATVTLLAMEQMIRFCTTSAGRVAYATAGDGPALVFPAWWVSDLESNWEDPSFRSFLLALADRHTVVRYDRIGTGLSERRRGQGAISLEAEVELLGELLDHVDLARCTLFGFSSGGCISAAYAAGHPARVDRLVLFNVYADGSRIADEEVRRSMVSVVRRHWGLGARMLAGVFMPEGDADDLRRFARLQRQGATREMAASLLELTYEMDATDAYSRVVAPTLVLHRRDDRAVPYELGLEVASLIPGARFVPLEGSHHLPWLGDVRSLLAALTDFIALGEYPIAGPEPGPVTGEIPSLSHREREVLGLVAEGLSDPEIAERLVVSPHTVHRHVANIRAKLGQPSRAAAAATGARLGLI
jgi:pimeloyl-ACP methyl ester carboxylesterase/DNA-binding CsgD family transcriptional regulator